MSEIEVHGALTWGLLSLSVPTFLALRFISAPYGRHQRKGWGPSWPARLGWLVMEGPSLAVFVAGWALGEHRFEPMVVLLSSLWVLHYGYRALFFPWWMRMGGRSMPVSVSLMGVLFNVPNAYVNSRYVAQFGDYDMSWAADPRFTVGVALFLMGFLTHVWADHTLRGLRPPGATGYRVPQGGLYTWVSCPNYLGEIVQWSGWALATWSLPGLAFAVFTFANLAPRALTHHRWYRSQFSDYPQGRRALVPWVW